MVEAERTVQLILLRGGEHGQETVLDLPEEVVMGRGEAADVVVQDVLVSRTHCIFRPEPRGVVVEDLSSQNGTWVNGELVGRALLRHGDVVRVGNTRITVRIVGAAIAVDEPMWSDPDEGEVHGHEFMSKVVGAASLDNFQSQTLQFLSGEVVERTHHSKGSAWLNRRTRSVTALYRAGQIVQRQQDPEEMLARVLLLIIEVLEARIAAFVLVDEDDRMWVRAARDSNGRALRPDDVLLSKTVARRVIEGRVGVVRGDVNQDDAIPATDSIMDMPAGALMVVPMLVGNRVLGLLQVHSRRPGAELDEDDIGLASTIAGMTGTALENKEMAIQRERDIEALKRSNADLEAKKRELQEAQARLLSAERLAAIGQLASDVAHDGRNALQAMAALTLLKSRYPFDDEVQLYVDLALDGQQMVVEMLEEILAFVRQTPREDRVAEVSVAAVARSMVYLARMDPDLRGRSVDDPPHQLELIIDADPKVVADGGRLKQVVLNLIKNAAQAISQRPGSIIVRVGRTEDGAYVSVQDDGSGIVPEVQPRVFEPLFTTKKERGVGLGLHICRSIAERYGGTLCFETEVDVGTTFTLTLPQAVPT
ncbi:MAG: ATP-binding protein [Myxococcota bacterium]|nr:ATP-binding protein [Myxococcota bacterium]